jgi:predicted dithiol-disulfide oxidoreductase (DUF899 family)
MPDHAVVSLEEWVAARKKLLLKEKRLTCLHDELSRERRELPWVKVEKSYVFDGPDGKETLAELFRGKSRLIVHHFMFSPDWEEGCALSFQARLQGRLPIQLRKRDSPTSLYLRRCPGIVGPPNQAAARSSRPRIAARSLTRFISGISSRSIEMW